MFKLADFLLVGAGGSAGAVARFVVTVLAARWAPHFPLGTLLVNVMGCALIGALSFLSLDRGPLGPASRLLLITGFLGGLTTFSAFGFDTFLLAREGHWAIAGANIMLNVVLSLLAVWLGWNAARLAT